MHFRQHGCDVPGCLEPHATGGYCNAHYLRFRRFGTPQAEKPIKTKPGSGRLWIELHKNYEGDDCLIWPYWRHDRSGAAMTDIDGGKKRKPVAVIMCEYRHGPPPGPGFHAAHSCGKGHTGCANPNHLSWKTPKENMADKVGHGTQLRGEQIKHLAKLTEAQAKEIKYATGSQREIAKRFGVTQSNVSCIKRGISWSWL